MLVFDNTSKPLILDSIHVPTLTDHIWVLDLTMMDYTLTPLVMLEETICATIVLELNGFQFTVPANWNIVVFDPESTQLDVVEVANISGREFHALVYGPNMTRSHSAKIKVVDYIPEHANVGPSLNKHMIMCHPIGPDTWVNVGPNDSYNKYLKNKLVGDIIE